ncbi:DUF5320 domain-containing protein [Ancylomarina sp. DW003]|nr:DUF5320 domain-containing protein [Ancylomarina sp. DW003]MDE5423523.1 DUF5320 domain-containing protein [Ancylomarina sp. DW003]
MPRFNGMGPEGKGSQTGRGLGKCNAANKNVVKRTEDQNKDEFKNSGNGKGRQNRRRGKC